MIRSRATTPVLVVLASLVLLSPWSLGGRPAFASAADQFRESVLVTGTGEVSATPDTLTADFAVEATAATVAQALEGAGVAATRMHDALVRAGIATADLQTSNFSIVSKVNDDQAIVGYTVNQGLSVKIRDLRRAGEVMSAAIAAGGDAARLNGVSFAVENDAALLAEARRSAFADARQKAELYAREAGRPLGRVLTVSESSPADGGPGGQHGLAAMDSRFPIEPGRQQLAVTVTVQWALDPPSKHA
ncbi:SIMPL domain-containing protein [Actinoplanes sp. NPDC051411]|uniref:SIMPL domain-containing protein n=1 Tax=Actinoplanes sp. NPDC051411 TaxID=3155522 RepID=UPI00344A45CF